MKKILIPLSVLLAVLIVAASVVRFKPVKLEAGTSELYTEAEIQSAFEVVQNQFDAFKGCKLFSLRYAGDAQSLKEQDYDAAYTQAIVIDSVFLSPLFGGGSWNSHELYTWHFILMRNAGEEWTLLTYGYC